MYWNNHTHRLQTTAQMLVISNVAEHFIHNLEVSLTPYEFAKVVHHAKTFADNFCASHDYCDANELMHEAFLEALGREPDVGGDTPESERDVDMWNAAWQVARAKMSGNMPAQGFATWNVIALRVFRQLLDAGFDFDYAYSEAMM